MDSHAVMAEEIAALRQKNKELLDALKEIADTLEARAHSHDCTGIHCPECSPMELVEMARAAIAKAESL